MTEMVQLPEESNVCVAVKIRPLVPAEVDDGCRPSLFVTPGIPQVSSGQHTFTYDHVFGEDGTMPDQLYTRCIAPLVDGLFRGYNATVFAYGQTGSGKTFTMGSEYKPSGRCRGVIPDAINDIFNRIGAAKDCAITVRVSFVEIHKEEVKDLLLPASNGPRPAVTIRETQSGDVALYGAVEKEVRSREEMADVLEMGTLCRSTASTSMNNRSSRSHAIFTITLEQRRQIQQASTPTLPGDGVFAQGGDDDGEEDDEAGGEDAEGLEDFLGAKMNLVDLAGSERAKRTKAEGARLREGIHINRGLLALGNVINAIVDNHKHVPYRDSKLTRLLQDSLGGNSRTVMIACVSPADSNFEESLNTLRYADRARHIRNKPVVNRDPVAAQLAVLRNTIAQLKSENVSLKRALAATSTDGALDSARAGGGFRTSTLEGLVDRLTQENSSLESDNMRLRMEMDDFRRDVAIVTDKWHTVQAQCDLLRMNQAAAAFGLQQNGNSQGGNTAQDGSALPMPGLDIVKGYVARIAELEAEMRNMRSLAAHMPFTRRRPHGGEPGTPGGASTPGEFDSASPDPSPLLRRSHAMGGGGEDADGEDDPNADQHPELAVEEEYFMAEVAAHTLNEEKMKKEVALLQRQLEAKERKMVELMKNTGSMPALKQHYDRVLADLESQRDTLVSERKALLEKLAATSAANEEERKRLETTYRDRIHQYDERLKELRRKERDYIAMQKLKQRTEEAHRRLSADITRLKQQKVAVQKQLETNAKQFTSWRQERERELAQLRKQSRKDRAHIQQLEAMQVKQNAVLQRKISDANAARKRLKELQEAASRRVAGNSSVASQQQVAAAAAAQQALGGNVEIQPNVQAPLLRTDKDRKEWLQKELELCNMSCEFRKVIDGELAQRAEASRKLKELEKRLTLLDQLQPASPLFMAGVGGAVLPISPSAAAAVGALGGSAAIGPEARDKLLAKKKELGDKVAHHNAQISELQADWERQKSEEESRGGGAMDVRRWAGLRNVVECRELLRTLFRISVESKTLSNELTVDMVRYSEEVDVLRVQLEGAQKKSAQYRKLAMALQAAAAHVVSAPHHTGVSTQDETDKQVDAVLEALHVVRNNTPPAAAAPVDRGKSNVRDAAAIGSGARGGRDAAAGCRAHDVEMQDVDNPDTPNKALEFLSPVPSGGRPRAPSYDTLSSAAQRYSPDHVHDTDDDEGDGHEFKEREAEDSHARSGGGGGGRKAAGGEYCAMDVDDDDEEEDEDEDSDDDDDDDDDWNPSKATPAVKGRGTRSSRRASSVPAGGGGGDGGSGSGGPRRTSRRQSRDESAALAEEEDASTPQEAPGRRGNGGGSSRRNSSSRRSTSSAADEAALEAPVLDDINLKRYSAGHKTRLAKLTVAVLKDALKGQVIDGQRWALGSKNRAALILDYRRLLGLDRALPLSPDSETKGTIADVGETDVRALIRCNRSEVARSVDVSVGGAKPRALEGMDSQAPEYAEDEGFTFSPHLPTAPCGATGRPTSPCHTPSGRRLASGNSLGPWARSSLNAQSHSARNTTTWASSLRASCTLPTSEPAAESTQVPGILTRSNSGTSGNSTHRAVAPLPAWGSPSNGQAATSSGALRESLSYRGAVLASPQPSPSPRVPRPSGNTATGATSPRSSMSSPPPRAPSRSAGKAPGGGGWSPGGSVGSRDRGYDGGENLQPGCSTPMGTTPGMPGSAKGTPLATLYKEKTAEAKERTAALRASMQRNWEQHDPQQHPRGGSGLPGSANGRFSMNGLSGAVGTATSSMEGLRGSAGLRDSVGAGGGGGKNQKAIWR